jgi:hypothetical protein
MALVYMWTNLDGRRSAETPNKKWVCGIMDCRTPITGIENGQIIN